MAYRAGRSEKPVETLELIDSSGKVAATIEVNLNLDGMARRVSERYLDLTRVQDKYANMDLKEKLSPDTYEELGKAVINLYESVFGEQDTRTILDFYEGNYTEMAREINPFIINVVIPKVRRLAKARQDSKIKRFTGKTGWGS